MTTWMVRAGVDGNLFQKFIKENLVAIGWSEID